MIPQDLIDYVESHRPEVLPGTILYRDSACGQFRFGNPNVLPMYYANIGEDHAAALLTVWLTPKFCADAMFDVLISTFKVDDVVDTNRLLSALWEAYKKVKGIKE